MKHRLITNTVYIGLDRRIIERLSWILYPSWRPVSSFSSCTRVFDTSLSDRVSYLMSIFSCLPVVSSLCHICKRPSLFEKRTWLNSVENFLFIFWNLLTFHLYLEVVSHAYNEILSRCQGVNRMEGDSHFQLISQTNREIYLNMDETGLQLKLYKEIELNMYHLPGPFASSLFCHANLWLFSNFLPVTLLSQIYIYIYIYIYTHVYLEISIIFQI